MSGIVLDTHDFILPLDYPMQSNLHPSFQDEGTKAQRS